MKIGSGGFVTAPEVVPVKKIAPGVSGQGVVGWKQRNSQEVRADLAARLQRAGKTPAEIRKELAAFDAKNRFSNVPK